MEIELEYPELKLIKEEHKIKFMKALQTKDKKEMKKKCDLVIDEIYKDIKFTGEKFLLVMVMNNYMLKGATDIMKLITKEGFI